MDAEAAVVAAIVDEVLEARLVDWAREYGGGKYVSLGFSTGEHVLSKLITFGGFMPSGSGMGPTGSFGLTAADVVENIVRRMAQGWPGHALVLRCEYFRPNQAMPARLDWLRAKGVKCGRSNYFAKLESAKLYVAGALP